MNVVVSDLRPIVKEDGTWIRFSVTLQENGEPLWTQEGFLLTPRWEIRTPATRSRYGTVLRTYTHLSPKFEELLKAALEAIPDVRAEMAPRLERKIEGEGKVL